MKHFYFVRHAKSSWDDASLHDSQRPLNARGERDAPLMAMLLAQRGVSPDLLIASPAVRAQRTAQLFAERLGYALDAIYTDARLYEATVEDVLEVLESTPDEVSRVLFFGHNMAFTYLAYHFGEGIENLPTAGVISLESTAQRWLDVHPSNTRIMAIDFPKMYR